MTVDNYFNMMRRKKTNVNQDLLNEELKRFNQINDYDSEEGLVTEMNFYQSIPEEFYGSADDEKGEKDVILGMAEAEDEEGDIDAAIDDVADDLGDEEGGEEEGEEELDLGDEEGGEEELDMGGEEEMPSDEVEIDVTELVTKSEEAKESSEMVNQKMEDLLGQFSQLSGQLQKMDGLASKIEDMENEMEKRMPTPEEKLEMRSLDSYPYNLSLTDYWADKEGQYDVMDGESENSGKPKEYVLTKDKVDSTYNEMSVRKDIGNEYEEEDI